MVLTFTLLALAVMSLWATGPEPAPWLRRYLWLGLSGAAVIAALGTGIAQPIALVWVIALTVAGWAFSRPVAPRWQLAMSAAVILALAGGLMLHRLPGFENPRVISALRLTPDAIPYTLYLNFDKTIAGILILGWCHSRIARVAGWRAMFVATAPWAAGLFGLIMVLSLAAGYVRFEPKFPPQTWLWLGVNLGFTCMAEEALFRGFIQAQLQRAWRNTPAGCGMALAVAAVLFGLAHAAGGPMYVALSTVAGLGYGWVYQRTGRIEASILTHFGLNAVHFFLFTYPALR